VSGISGKFALFLLAASAPAAADPYRIAAIAADSGAVVLAAPDGTLQRLRRGEAVPQSAWHVAEIRGERVTFVRGPQDGSGLSLDAAQGDRIDFTALDQRHGTSAAAPLPADGRVIIRRTQTR
jgi:hypothetical protein